MESSVAGPNNAQQHPPPPVQVPQWEYSLNSEPGGVVGGGSGVLDGFAIGPDSKKALLSFITTGQASKEELKQLYVLCLSGLVKEEKKSPSESPLGHKTSRSPSMAQASNENMPALPPTPATTEDESPTTHDPLHPIELPRDLKDFFLNLHHSGKIPLSDLEKIYNLSPLAKLQHFTSFVESSESSKGGLSDQASDMQFSGFGYSLEEPAFLAQPGLRRRRFMEDHGPGFSDFSNFNGPTSPSIVSPGPFGMLQPSSLQEHNPSYITPTFLDQNASYPFPAQNQIVSPTQPMFANYNPLSVQANINQQEGSLPSPVATRASSQSEGPSEPNVSQADESTAEVTCPIPKADGSICGKRCGGAKRYRSMQEHIRRAHPEKYLQNLPANETSFQSMVDAGGTTCTITDDNDNMCGERFTGNKRYRLIQDHVREKHPDYWVSDLPGNEQSYKILMSKPETVLCPLPKQGGGVCTKHTFGEKRWRSLQEHIRRAHADYYIAGLNATEESILRICSKAGVTLAPPRKSKEQLSGPQKKKPTASEQLRQRAASSKPAGPSTIEAPALQEQAVTALPPDNAQQTFESPYFPQQIQTTMQATLAPSALESDVFSPSALATAFPSFQDSYPQMFGNDHLFLPGSLSQDLPQSLASLQHTGLGMNLARSVATPTAQNLNQTLSPELFSGQAIAGHQQAMQTVYGDSYTASLGQLAQPTQSFLSLQGMQPMSPLQPVSPLLPISPLLPMQHSLSDGGLFPYSSAPTMPAQQHPASLSPATPTAAKNTAFSKPQPMTRKRKASQANGSDSKTQSPPTKKPSLGINANISAPAKQTGAPISPMFIQGSHIRPSFARPDAGTTGPQEQPVPASISLTPTKIQPRPNQMSPYFQSQTTPQSTGNVKRKDKPGAGLVPSVPTPPLHSDCFGLIQEELADDPLRLLIATHLLVKSIGKRSIEIFRVLMQRYPTPQDLCAAKHEDVEIILRPTGLAKEKANRILNLVASWLKNTPTKNVRYAVKDYPLPGDGKNVTAREVFGPEETVGPNDDTAMTKASGFGTSWEVGHLITGPYMLDSWRIFCRDKLLGRAEDWKGKGTDPGFQPEWMRVLPKDKELRAYLYWMWMKEGYDWDAETGNKEPLSEEMRSAVNEGRVSYAETGKLIIVN